MAQSRTVVASAGRTATGSSAAIDIGEYTHGELSVLLEVTAVSGTTPSLTVSVEWSNDAVDWFTPETADAFNAITAAATRRTKEFDIKARYYRVVWTITGTTPSFTFEVHEYVNPT